MCRVLLLLILLFLSSSQGGAYNHVSRLSRSTTNIGPVEVRLAMFCDTFCNDRFHSSQRMVDFIVAKMMTANLKFSVLKNAEISFRVTSLHVFESESEQAFLSESKAGFESINMTHAFGNFSQWLLANKNNYTDFDVGVLVTGLRDPTLFGFTEVGGVCRLANNEPASIVMSLYPLFGGACGLLEKLLAMTLGASSKSLPSLCTTNKCQEAYESCEYLESSLTPLSEEEIIKSFESGGGACLGKSRPPHEDVLYRNWSSTIPSLQDQCELLLKRRDVFEVHQNCAKSVCLVPLNNNLTNGSDIFPLANTPCGESKRCFRGSCQQVGYLLESVGGMKCIGGSSKFLLYDDVKFLQCAQVPSPFDMIMAESNDKNTGIKILMRVVSSSNTNTNKCLAPVKAQGTVRFYDCFNSTITADKLTWTLIMNEINGDQFLLYHPQADACLEYVSGALPKLRNECNDTNKNMLWRFRILQIPTNWMSDKKYSTAGNITVPEIKTDTGPDSDTGITGILLWVGGVSCSILVVALTGFFVYKYKYETGHHEIYPGSSSPSRTLSTRMSTLFSDNPSRSNS